MKRLAAATAAVLAAAVLYHADPAASPLYPPCLIRLYTGWSCPGCGATRALHALLHFRFEEAWRLNPLWTAAAPALAVWGLWRLFAVRCWRRAA